MIDIKKLYDTRFTSFERVRKAQLWKILCNKFIQKFIRPTDTVVDLGAGHCEFINNISCLKKIAIDVNEDIRKFNNKNVQVITAPVKTLKNIFEKNSVDVIFMSNLLEHLDNKEDVFRLLNEAYFVLRAGGRLLIMQPDIRLVGHQYWDFFDHKVPITFSSLLEVLLSNNFKIKFTKYPFLPYSTKVKHLPLHPFLFLIYLKFRPLQIIFGKQFFICAQK
jgi:ubiquinone/menaquinone biosynthesis C-methylase UbiE